MAHDTTAKSEFLPKDTHAPARPGILWRPTAKRGLLMWLTTVDHKRIGFLSKLLRIK